ncbi:MULTISPECIES: co-chaperone GroES [Larkinella]|jgi:chaperonin GroES|uniref:Co-chaperone GroES n=1 Tax=Larkinella humicola TaxID=2607654 RepID=A0A5N1JFU1_9BACT|nr:MULTISPECIES: co-chaperone GroES family protein [Larkinella]KAA9354589.1 co-chaperone GroES [Larkinella humicola]
MEITADNRLRRLIVVGDRVLVKPKNPSERTNSGLYLPPTVTEKEQVQSGYVIKVGPGYPIPSPSEEEPWKETEEKVKYMPLQALEGDLAIYLQRNAIELEYEGEKYCIVPQSAILLLERSENLFD